MVTQVPHLEPGDDASCQKCGDVVQEDGEEVRLSVWFKERHFGEVEYLYCIECAVDKAMDVLGVDDRDRARRALLEAISG